MSSTPSAFRLTTASWCAMSESGMNMKSTSSDSPGNGHEIWIVYDGLCPFCSRYVLMYRIRQLIEKVHLIDARSDDPLVRELSAKGFDLNEGMAVKWNGGSTMAQTACMCWH